MEPPLFHTMYTAYDANVSSSLLKSMHSSIFWHNLLQHFADASWIDHQQTEQYSLANASLDNPFLNRGILFRMQFRHDHFDPQIALLVDVSVPPRGYNPEARCYCNRIGALSMSVLLLICVYLYIYIPYMFTYFFAVTAQFFFTILWERYM